MLFPAALRRFRNVAFVAFYCCCNVSAINADEKSPDEETNNGFRARVPAIPPTIEAKLKQEMGYHKGNRIHYRHSNDSGRSPDTAVVIDAGNALNGIDASRHLLNQRFPNAALDMPGYFKQGASYCHVWRVSPKQGESFLMFINATYFHFVF